MSPGANRAQDAAGSIVRTTCVSGRVQFFEGAGTLLSLGVLCGKNLQCSPERSATEITEKDDRKNVHR